MSITENGFKNVLENPTIDIALNKMGGQYFCQPTSLQTIPIENIPIFTDNSRRSSTEIDLV